MIRSRVVGAAFALFVVTGLVFVLARAFGSDPHRVPFLLSGAPAPQMSIVDLRTGERVSLQSLRGTPVIINFWATWCPPCVAEHSALSEAARRLEGRAKFLGIVFEDSEASVRSFLSKHAAPYPVLFEEKSTAAVDFGVSGVPETYIVDANGIILGKTSESFGSADQVVELFESLTARHASR